MWDGELHSVDRGTDVEATKALIVSLSTYSAPFNDGKLEELGKRLGYVTAVAGDVPTLWGRENQSRTGRGYRVEVLKTWFPVSNATLLLRGLRRIAGEVKPTLIHVECEPWQGVAVQSVLLATKLRVPVGIQFAENGPLLRGPGGAVRRTVARATLRRCSYAIGWSSGSAAVGRLLAPELVIGTLPGTGVSETTRELAQEDDGEEWFGPDAAAYPKLAFVGRFSQEKGFQDFLNVADSLAERLPVRVAIAGGESSDPVLTEWLKNRPWARTHGVLSRPRAAQLVASADVLVCPSRTLPRVKEQFGKAPVEAMLLGTPPFGYDCGALREVIADGGVVVAEGARNALVDALEHHFASSGESRRELAARAKAQAAKFTDGAVAEELLRLWGQVIGGVLGARGRHSPVFDEDPDHPQSL